MLVCEVALNKFDSLISLRIGGRWAQTLGHKLCVDPMVDFIQETQEMNWAHLTESR